MDQKQMMDMASSMTRGGTPPEVKQTQDPVQEILATVKDIQAKLDSLMQTEQQQENSVASR